MTAGVLTIFLSYLSKFFKPVQDLAKMTNAIAQTAVGVERIRTILETDNIIPERSGRVSSRAPARRNRLRSRGSSATQGRSGAARRQLRHRKGQIVGIVGPTGSGKSTVVSLIPRFYDPTAGNGDNRWQRYSRLHVQGLRQHIGFVLQDTVLFRGTIAENIAYGRPERHAGRDCRGCGLANADEFIEQMPHGYDTMVGDRGLTLSGGQRQRIGIARAMIRNNPILILDEPTAALDSESESRVIEALERLMKGRTVIMIAHRLSTIRDARQDHRAEGWRRGREGNHDS